MNEWTDADMRESWLRGYGQGMRDAYVDDEVCDGRDEGTLPLNGSIARTVWRSVVANA